MYAKYTTLTRVKWIFKTWSLEIRRFYNFADIYQLYGGSFTSIYLRCKFSSKDAGSRSSKKLVPTFDNAYYHTAEYDNLMFEGCEGFGPHTIKEQFITTNLKCHLKFIKYQTSVYGVKLAT